MDPARWRRLVALFEAARALSDRDRTQFLAVMCPDDPALRREVRSLCARAWEHDVIGPIIESSARAMDPTPEVDEMGPEPTREP